MTVAQDIAVKILHLVEKSPTLQSELVNILGVRDQRTAEAVRILTTTHKITRVRKGRTYLLSLNGTHRKVNKDALLYNNIFSPCAGCRIDCDPRVCDKLSRWVS